MKKLTEKDIARAAATLKTGIAEIKTVREVESRGEGFQSDGRPTILFERHIFHKYTKGRFAKSHPDLSNPVAGGYGKTSAQWGRFERAAKLDLKAAKLSISMGLFQIMGFNHELAGYSSVDAFFAAMHQSEGEQLMAFCRFLKASKLDDELRDHEWRAFARGYNGPAYRKNNYDVKLAAAYKKYAAMPQRIDQPSLVTPDNPLARTSEDALDARVAAELPFVPVPSSPEPATEKATDNRPLATDQTDLLSIEGLANAADQVIKRADSIKSLRLFWGMLGLGGASGVAGFWENNQTLIFIALGVIVGFSLLYFLRQWHLGAIRERKQ